MVHGVKHRTSYGNLKQTMVKKGTLFWKKN